MARLITLRGLICSAIALVLVLLAIGWLTREDPASKPYLNIAGGGFLFNYRIAEVTYGFTAVVIRPLPVGSIIEASFEDPAGGADHVVRKRVGTDTVRYGFQSPPVRGVAAGVPYQVSIRVIDREETKVLWTDAFGIKSQMSDKVVPEKPLTIGPGYAKNTDD
ncbi:MAG: hypothetical protein AB3N20_13390 [Rhizobiaceae bacterium]